MKKLTEKVALVALICITLVFVLTTMLYMSNIIPQADTWLDNGVMTVLMFVMALLYVGVSGYLLYVNFSESQNIKRILLFCDSESATHANAKVVSNIVKSCANQVDGIAVKRVKVRADDKKGFVLTVTVNVDTDQTAVAINNLRCLLMDGFKSALGLTFDSINFVIVKLKNHYVPNVKTAQQKAQTLTEQQEQVDEIYQDPLLDEKCSVNNEQDDKQPEEN